MTNQERLEQLQAQAASMKEVPLGLKISISKLQNELNPEEDGDCLMCGS